MTERDDADRPPTGPSKVTTYTAGRVPGVYYQDGVAHSPPDPVPPAASAPPPPPPRPASPPPSARRPDRPPPPTRPTRRGRGFSFGRLLLFLLIILLVGLLVFAGIVWARIDKVDAVPDDHGGAVSDGHVYVLVGSDSRADLTEEERRELGTGSASSQLADTIMLLYIPNSGRPALVSVPRDSLVDIPGRGTTRINAAYSFGGPGLLVETIELNTGVAVDDYVEIGFGGFASLVDALGGVEMCLEDAIRDEKAHIDLPAGCQDLDGSDALGYARARSFDPRADLGRVERQREILGAIAGDTLSPSTLLNPVKLARVGLAGGNALTIDEGTSPFGLARFAWTLGRVTSGAGDTLTVPVGRVGNTVEWDSQRAPALWAAMQDGAEIPSDLFD